MLQIAITLSILLGFIITEVLGLYTGGLISAGYMAFFVEQPYRLVSTILLAVLITLIVRVLEHFIFLYGRRRFMATVLLSLIGAWLFEEFSYHLSFIPQDMRIVGYMIPGLIANDMIKQGIIKTTVITLLIAFVIRLIETAGVFA